MGKMENNCCSKREKHRSKEEFEKLINRLNRISGQIRGIKKMVENSAYCSDILVQSIAAQSALRAFNKELLSNHMNSCVVDDIKEGKTETMDELIQIIHKLMK